MYGFGDDQNPYTESVDLLEDLVIEYIIETTHRWDWLAIFHKLRGAFLATRFFGLYVKKEYILFILVRFVRFSSKEWPIRSFFSIFLRI